MAGYIQVGLASSLGGFSIQKWYSVCSKNRPIRYCFVVQCSRLFFSDQLRMGSWCASWRYPTNLHYVDFAVSNFSYYIHLLARAPCKNGPSEKKKGGQRTFFHRALHYYFSLHLVSPAQRLRGAILWPWKIWENFLVLWFIHIFKTVHLQHWVKSDAKS